MDLDIDPDDTQARAHLYTLPCVCMRFCSYLLHAIQKVYARAQYTYYYGIYENIRKRCLHLIACDLQGKQACVQEPASRQHFWSILH
jgi:hypothetical protein